MPYIPNSAADRQQMLEKIGISSLDDLFAHIPEHLRLKSPLDIPSPLAEPDVVKHLEALADKNKAGELTFLGGGIYNHYVPPVVWTLAMRPEFATAYTPYQAEVAQGTLQAIYEFQTHLCRLFGMDVANASMYDGATAMAEAALLAVSHTRRNRIAVTDTVNPFYREVLVTMLSGRDIELVTIPARENVTDTKRFGDYINDQTACVVVQQPNFFGYLEEITAAEEAIHEAGGLFIIAADPISMGMLKSPAEYKADIAVGEGQSLGIPQSFGGPLLGLFTARKEFVRKIPGRLVARTVDAENKTGFVLTLQTREQHIRRDKATSNICTSEALCATAATIYLSLLGRQGLTRLARVCTERAHYLAEKVNSLGGYQVWSTTPFFKEFVIKTPVPPARIIAEMAEVGIAAGIDLGRFYPHLDHHLLVAVTEMLSFADCDRFGKALSRLAAGEKLTGAKV